MSTQIPPKKAAPGAAKKPNLTSSKPVTGGSAPARKRVASTPLTTRATPKRRDWWPWNFMGGMVIVIFGIGALVWGLRAAISAPPPTPVVAPTATALAALPTPEAPKGSPVAEPVATATLAAPNALQNGPYAPVQQLASTVGSIDQAHIRPTLIPYIPAGRLAVSQETHDWGQIAASGVVSAVLTVANIGNGPVHVDQLLSSCSCLTGNMSAQDLPVGNRATLVALYDPGLDGQKGAVERTLSILSTAGNETVKTLTFKATIP
jgi:hypothetical protein